MKVFGRQTRGAAHHSFSATHIYQQKVPKVKKAFSAAHLAIFLHVSGRFDSYIDMLLLLGGRGHLLSLVNTCSSVVKLI